MNIGKTYLGRYYAFLSLFFLIAFFCWALGINPWPTAAYLLGFFALIFTYGAGQEDQRRDESLLGIQLVYRGASSALLATESPATDVWRAKALMSLILQMRFHQERWPEDKALAAWKRTVSSHPFEEALKVLH
jgi:hypothetical protein